MGFVATVLLGIAEVLRFVFYGSARCVGEFLRLYDEERDR